MSRLKSVLFSVLLLGVAGSSVTAEEVWSLDGLKAPESVLFDAKRNVFYVSNIVGEPSGKDGSDTFRRLRRTASCRQPSG